MESIVERLKSLAKTLDKVQNHLEKGDLHDELYDQRCNLQDLTEDIGGEDVFNN